MRVMAQVAMVMNLDKCIGCHTCSVTCKQVWTNRPGMEYVYFNNVETKPRSGYPRRYTGTTHAGRVEEGDRYVIPPAHAEDAGRLMSQHEQLFCSLDTDGGPGMGGHGPPASVGTFHPAAEPGGSQTFRGDDGRLHFNLLGWDGQDNAPGLFPDRGTS